MRNSKNSWLICTKIGINHHRTSVSSKIITPVLKLIRFLIFFFNFSFCYDSYYLLIFLSLYVYINILTKYIKNILIEKKT